MNLDNIFSSLKKKIQNFLPKRYMKALYELKKNKKVRVCRADKGGKIVVIR